MRRQGNHPTWFRKALPRGGRWSRHTPPTTVTTATPGAQRRVLVVEDDPTIVDAIATRLRAEGFLVQTAGDGPSAVDTAEAWQPDLLILDIMLPGFDGLEVCRRVQAARPVPVMMLTARDDETDMLVGLGVGADDYMTKPFSMRELAARVHVLLRRVERAALAAATPRSGSCASASWRSTTRSAGCGSARRTCT